MKHVKHAGWVRLFSSATCDIMIVFILPCFYIEFIPCIFERIGFFYGMQPYIVNIRLHIQCI